MSPDDALLVCRFAHDAAAMLLWGAYAYLAALVPQDLAGPVDRALTGFRRGTASAAILSTAVLLPLEAGHVGTGWGDAVDPGTIGAVLFQTSLGPAWAAQALAALALAATLAARPRGRPTMVAGASGLLAASLGLTGHAALHEGALGVAHRLNDAAHVLAAGAWFGALVPLIPVLRALDAPDLRLQAGVALRRFSAAGHGAVALVLVTGGLNTLLVLGHWPRDRSSPYQVLLAGKIALVGVMTVLAIGNRYAVVPWIGRDRKGALHRLRLVTLVELVIGLAVIGLVSVFGMLDPT